MSDLRIRQDKRHTQRAEFLPAKAVQAIRTTVFTTRAETLEDSLRLWLAHGSGDWENEQETPPSEVEEEEDGGGDEVEDTDPSPGDLESADALGPSPRQRQVVDVLVEEVEGGLQIASGLSPLLLTLTGRGALVRAYHLCLRTRIETTLNLARVLVEKNADFFHGHANVPVRLQSSDLPTGISKDTLTRLRGTMTLLTPSGQVLVLRDFLVARSSDNGTDLALLRLVLEQLEVDRENPWTDEYLARSLGWNGRDVKQDAVRKARKRLGIPSARDRKKAYERCGDDYDLLRKWACGLRDDEAPELERLLDQLEPQVKGAAKGRAAAWKEALCSKSS